MAEDEATAFELEEGDKKDEKEESTNGYDPLQTPPQTPSAATAPSQLTSSRSSRIRERLRTIRLPDLPESVVERIPRIFPEDPRRRRLLLAIGGAKLVFIILILLIVYVKSGSDSSPLQSMEAAFKESFDLKKADFLNFNETSPRLPDLYKLASKTNPDELTNAYQVTFIRELTRAFWKVSLEHLLSESPKSPEETLQRTALLASAIPTLSILGLSEELAAAESWLKRTCSVGDFWAEENLKAEVLSQNLEDYLQTVLACYKISGANEATNETIFVRAKEFLDSKEKDSSFFYLKISADLRIQIPSFQRATLKEFEARSSEELLADFTKFCYRGPPLNSSSNGSSSHLSPLAYLRVLVPLHLQSKLPWHLVTKYQALISAIITKKLWTSESFDFSKSCSGELKFEMTSFDCDLGGLLALSWAASPNSWDVLGASKGLLETAQGIAGGCGLVSEKNGLTPKVFEMTASGRWVGMGLGSGVSPELLYSYLVLYRLTGETKYRSSAFQAASTLYRLALDFGTEHLGGRLLSELADLERTNTKTNALRKSKLLSRTLRYLYLIFSTGGRGSSSEEKLDELKRWLIGVGSVVPL